MTLSVVITLAIGTYAFRLAGPLFRDRLRVSESMRRLMSIAAITLLAAFVAVSALVESGGFAGWARLAGVGLAGVLAFRRAPFVLVVVVAAVTTAGLRWLGLG